MQVKETRKYPRPGSGTPGPGRPKGVPNETTTLLKDANSHEIKAGNARLQISSQAGVARSPHARPGPKDPKSNGA